MTKMTNDMKTPDTELEENIKSALSSNPALRDKILALIPAKNSVVAPDTEWEKKFDEEFVVHMNGEKYFKYVPTPTIIKDIKSFFAKLLSSRDTYWKERVRKESDEILEVLDLYNSDGHLPYSVNSRLHDMISGIITNEDNLK